MKKALLSLISNVQATGGLLQYGNGTCAPAGDPTWTDLGDTVLDAKAALEDAGETVDLTIQDLSDEYESCDEYDDSGA